MKKSQDVHGLAITSSSVMKLSSTEPPFFCAVCFLVAMATIVTQHQCSHCVVYTRLKCVSFVLGVVKQVSWALAKVDLHPSRLCGKVTSKKWPETRKVLATPQGGAKRWCG